MRSDGRKYDQIRPVKFTPHFLAHPPGSCLVQVGLTRVACSVMVEETVPPFLKGSGKGWLTAEYNMLPASSSQRIVRERNKVGGRTQEIQRLIGRSLRNCIDLQSLGERSLLVDCDVLDADGGTRTAAITGAYVALALAIHRLKDRLPRSEKLLKTPVAAVSVGVVAGQPCLDLNYDEDKSAEVDMNIVKISGGRFVEVQGTAEGQPFDTASMNRLIELANLGIEELFTLQERTIQEACR